jgi:coenzyme F420-0:L-glutamate ligase/coenzyme F420-1:gamma-L-glutamate ligase
MVPTVQIIPLQGLPEIAPGDDLAGLILRTAKSHDLAVRDGDIIVVAQKIVSKAEGRLVRLADIVPSGHARAFAAEHGKDPHLVEVVLRESRRILKMERGIIVAETGHGFICANAGVDASNAPDGTAILLPEDPDASAARLQAQLSAGFAVPLGVIVADTFGRPWREGLVNVALGVAGLAPLIDYRGQKDANGKQLTATIIALADELASAAELVMGKSSNIPVVLIRGVDLGSGRGSGRDLLRPPDRDLFR